MSFFKLHKPSVYKYKPIYYDPKKEAQEERRKRMEQANKSTEGNKGEYEPQILRRGIFREIAEKERHSARKRARESNFRLLIILIILFAIAYFLMK
ncbi:MAG TPA: hypothetical protein PLO29_03205 [Paludibacter sp.]|jgi:hypothetical protein|nr:MAG: hypothetical protein BWY08_02140 [Bacteroidetes bacterium ADurb.Bin174]HQB27936.1 hypothetical protein [Paludibacter sp.]